MKRTAILGLLAAMAVCAPVRATGVPTPKVKIDQHLNAQLPLGVSVTDDHGTTAPFGNFLKGKPAVLVFIYYRCPKLCGVVQDSLVSSLRKIKSLTVGKDFRVLAVSFDPTDTIDSAAVKKRAVVARYERPGHADGFCFLTGSKESVSALAKAAGFEYYYDKKSDLFVHAAGIMVVTPKGKLSRYYYGISYKPSDLRLGLVEASNGKIGSLVDQLTLLCCVYDPTTGRYGLSIMKTLRLGGLITVLIGGGWILFALWRERRSNRLAA